ncbi:MAG: hypothetical protein ACI9XO_000386 [Paraglaciecola sp.]|jgi:hypothetical protein
MVVWTQKSEHDELYLVINGQLVYKKWFKGKHRDTEYSIVFNESAFGDKNRLGNSKHYKIASV